MFLCLFFWAQIELLGTFLIKTYSIIKGNSVVMQKLMAAWSDSKMNIGEKENANHKERKSNNRNVWQRCINDYF